MLNKSLSKWLSPVTKANDLQGLKTSGVNRRINREKFELNQLKDELSNNKRRQGVFNGLRNMISIRKESTAFSPFADQKVVDLDANVFALIRENKNTNERIFFAVNVSGKKVTVKFPFDGTELQSNRHLKDEITLSPYEFIWVK